MSARPRVRLGRDAGPALPPTRLRFMGESDESYVALGDHMVEMLTAYAGLAQDSRVFDIGCGYGRLAHALRRHGFAGSYLGVDVLKPHVRWCKRHLGGDGYGFRHIDMANGRYNPDGRVPVRDLDLGGARFDVIAAFSVFTHMWPEDVEAYFKIISGALAFGGRAAATFFLLDLDLYALAEAGKVPIQMPHERAPGCRYESEDDPLHRVAYQADWVLLTAADAGLAAAAPPVYGTWSSRPVDRGRERGYQDMIVFGPLDEIVPPQRR